MKLVRHWMATAAVCGLLLLGSSLSATETKTVNLNTATAAELVALKGIGEAKAKAIIDHREKNGPFKTVDDLKNVPGIGNKMLASLRPQLNVGAPTAGSASQPAPAAPAGK